MRRKTILLAITTILGSMVTGCRSHQAKVSDLQTQYNQLARQFQKDCNGEYLDVPPKISPKCKDEESKMNAAWSRLQAERSKE